MIRLLPSVAPLLLAAAAAGQCINFQSFQAKGTLPVGLLPNGTGEEISGMAHSRHNPGILWVHDDKGNGPYLLALHENGRLAQQYILVGVNNRDWEDIAIGPGPVPGKSYLYIAETGNNDLSYATSSIIRVEEPDVPPSSTAILGLNADVFTFQFPGGPRDAEALMIDPWDGTPWILTKESGLTGYLFRYPLPLDPTRAKTLVLETTFFHTKPSFSAADISPDGRSIYFRNRDNIHWVHRPWGATMKTAFQTLACYHWGGNQGNAESLAVAPDGLSLWATSEGKAETLWQSIGTPPANGPQTIPAAWCYGSGTSGAIGIPGIGTPLPPILGKTPLGWATFGGPANAGGLLVVSLTALDDFKFGWAGGWVHVLPDLIFPLQLDASGESVFSIGVLPDLPGFRGLSVHAQAFVIDPSATHGTTLSRGLTLQLDS